MRAKSTPIRPKEVDRSAGFLTKTEREYLLGEWAPGNSEPGDWSEKQGSRKRSDITTRTRHAIADIALLNEFADSALISDVIERPRDPDNIQTFHDDTKENAKYGLSEFMIRLALDPDSANDVIEVLHEEDWNEILEGFDDSIQDAKRVANQHGEFLNPMVQQLSQYASANDISKTEMKDAIDIMWPEK